MIAEKVNIQASVVETKVFTKEEYVTLVLRTKKWRNITLCHPIQNSSGAVGGSSGSSIGDHGCMVETRVFTKSEYVNLIPRVSTSDYESLKQSIKEHGGLLMPIILNQDKVVLDGHNP